jgi:hypothetical protein
MGYGLWAMGYVYWSFVMGTGFRGKGLRYWVLSLGFRVTG